MQKTCSTEVKASDMICGGRIIQFSFIRVIACFAVVVLHTVFAANEYFIDTLTLAENLFSRITENNMMWAVPLFLMVTGALQLRPGKKLTLRKLYGKYIARVFAALIAFSLLFRLFDIVMDGEVFNILGLLTGSLKELITGRGWGHLWYLYLLIGIYVMLPFYRAVAEKCSDRELRYLLCVFILFTSIVPMIEGFGLNIAFYISESLIYPLYLFAGYMIHYKRIRIRTFHAAMLLTSATLLMIILDILKYAKGIDVPGVFFGYSSILVVAQAIGLYTLIDGSRFESYHKICRIMTSLDKYTFGIYLISMLFVRLLYKYMKINPYDILGIPAFLTLAASVIFVFTVSCLTTVMLKKVPGFRIIL